jgi:hypothetical protein
MKHNKKVLEEFNEVDGVSFRCLHGHYKDLEGNEDLQNIYFNKLMWAAYVNDPGSEDHGKRVCCVLHRNAMLRHCGYYLHQRNYRRKKASV